MSKTWGTIGAWAAEAERAEAEEKEQEAAAAAAAAAAPPQSYPSLKEAVNTNRGKKKTKMSLQEFTMGGGAGGIGGGGGGGGGSRRDLAYEQKGLTPEEMMRLPTGPKERSAEEMQYGRLGGGFSSYGGGRSGGGGPRMRDRDADGDGSWGSNRRSYGGFDDDRRGSSSRVSEYDQQPSRADEVDNWAMAKKPMATSFDAGSRPNNRYTSLGGGGGGLSTGGGGGFSRADEIDNWAVNKKPIPPPPASRSSNFGSGFRDSGGPEPDRWSRGVVVPRDDNQERLPERRRLVLDPPKGESSPIESVVKTNKPNPFGNARPREEILAEKGLDWKKADLELEAKKISSRPTSSHSNSRPGSAQSGRSAEGLEKPRPKVNPFGDAKPREVLLQEKGVDYRKVDLELERRRLGRAETEAEKNLKEEIENLKREVEKENDNSLHDRIVEKERELDQLSHDLDDKLRFSQKSVERPGSGAGRVGVGTGFLQERPPSSQSGSYDESRSVDFSDRPRSRGGDSWMRGGDDRRGGGGGGGFGSGGGGGSGRDRGFMGNRDFGRSNSRERW